MLIIIITENDLKMTDGQTWASQPLLVVIFILQTHPFSNFTAKF